VSEKLIDEFIKDVKVRKTVRNWPADIKSIVDGYRSHTTISHAVQKDAIQNGWSARKNKKGKGWSFTFELIEGSKDKFLILHDSGTTGLTGRILSAEEYEVDQPGEERWARFEGVAFTQPREERTLGSRGRGKFVFVGASKESTILYDTLREDGTYRLGFRTVEKTESPIYAWDGETGRKKLTEITGGLVSSLESAGTRVIIINPIDELITDIKKGVFVHYIGETWWEIIQKYQVTIKVKYGKKEQIAEVPKYSVLKEEDSKQYKVWFRRHQKIPGTIEQILVKELHIIFDHDNVIPEDIRGIALQRAGMKICTIEPRYMDRKIAERIYGFINFDEITEELMLDDEGIEHYSYDFRKAVPGAIKRYVDEEIYKFAKEKLGYGIDAREMRRKQQQNAERRAIVAVNNIAKEVGIGTGPGRGTGGGGAGPKKPKKIYIEMQDVIFPRERDFRINYGEKISNIIFKVVNESDSEITVRSKLFLRFYDKLIKTFNEQDIRLPPKSSSGFIGPFDQIIAESEFPDRGRYTLVARILSLNESTKGDELDIEKRSFYLEDDPPIRGLFEKCEPLEFPERAKTILAECLKGESGGLVLEYNLNHPSQKAVENNEDDLAAYLVLLMGHELCRYDLEQETPVLFKAADRDNPDTVLQITLRNVGNFLYKFRQGEFG
jgi:hypothetical protein